MRRRPPRARTDSTDALAAMPFGMGRSGARLVALVLVALSLWLLANFVGQVIASARMDRQIVEKQAEMAKSEAELASLKDQVAFAESPAYAEQVAREQLGFAREGDTVVLPTLPERKAALAVAVPVPLPAPPPQSNWRGWVRALFPATMDVSTP
jgi:cell division protein FtsB